jgi:hypothetical protein
VPPLCPTRQFRNNIKVIRATDPPDTATEVALFREYRTVVRNFARELQVPNAKIDVKKLNDLEERAVRVAMQYVLQRGIRGVHGSD